MAIVWQPLPVPEAGWKRVLSSAEMVVVPDAYFSGRCVRLHGTGSAVKFNFTGTRLRLVTSMGYTLSLSVCIDGGPAEPLQHNCDIAYSLSFDKSGLLDKEHTCKLTVTGNSNNNSIDLEGIDVDETGSVLKYCPTLGKLKTSTFQMQIGDRIAIEYTALANTFGTFANIGKATKPDLPIIPTATPDGTFYFYHVGYDFLGRMKLVADRNIQHSISYDTLNTAGVASGSGLPIKIDSKDYTVRLLTGGTSTNDKDNEWDKIIVDSTLGGTITAGDNDVWNWISIYSYVSNLATPSNQPTIRGYGTVETLIPLGATTSFSSYQVGFRPMLLVEADPTINISKVTPTHLYGNQHSGCTVEAVAPISNAPIIYKTIINGAEDTFMSGEHHIDISKFRVGNNTVRVETTEGDSASVDVILEEPHRTSANRTFTSTDGGYLITNS